MVVNRGYTVYIKQESPSSPYHTEWMEGDWFDAIGPAHACAMQMGLIGEHRQPRYTDCEELATYMVEDYKAQTTYFHS